MSLNKPDLEVDKYSLDDEAVLVVSDYQVHVVNKLPEASEACDRAKAKMEEIKGNLDIDIRKNPKDYDLGDLGRLTESVINSTILNDPDFIQAQEDYFSAKRVLTAIKEIKNNLNLKSDKIDLLYKMEADGYFVGREKKREVKKPKDSSESFNKKKIKKRR
jgi:hypothetical protein